MVIAGSWDWQEGRMHGTPLVETPRAGAEPWPLRCATSACAPLLVVVGKFTENIACSLFISKVNIFHVLDRY